MKVPVLKNVDFSMEEGEYVAIMGPSGSGKTTLMNIIGCLDKQTEGTFFLDGVDIKACSENEMSDIRLNKIGFVFQSFHLLPKQSALANVEMPLNYARVPKKERRERALKALDRVGLADRVDFKPNQLSGGQKQRVSIARAMLKDAPVFVFDDSTSALDAETERKLLENLRTYYKERTILIAAHKMSSVVDCDEIIYLSNGKIVERGTFDELMELDGHFAGVYKTQMAKQTVA